jgi:biotin carboxyl carrier protein
MTTRRIDLTFGARHAAVEIVHSGTGPTARTDAAEIPLSIERIGDGVFAITVGRRRAIVHYATDGARHLLQMDGHVYEFRTGGAGGPGGAARHHHQDLAAPMPGIVTRIFVAEGGQVSPGDPLFVVEAMKMENVVRAPASGRVTRVHVASGAQVDAGAIVVEVEDG